MVRTLNNSDDRCHLGCDIVAAWNVFDPYLSYPLIAIAWRPSFLSGQPLSPDTTWKTLKASGALVARIFDIETDRSVPILDLETGWTQGGAKCLGLDLGPTSRNRADFISDDRNPNSTDFLTKKGPFGTDWYFLIGRLRLNTALNDQGNPIIIENFAKRDEGYFMASAAHRLYLILAWKDQVRVWKAVQ